MKQTMLFFTVFLVLVAFVAVPMIADATETQCAPQCPQCPPAQVEVVNKPVVKAKQRGQWDVTVNNTDSNPVPVTVQPDGITVTVTTGYRFVGFSAETTNGAAGDINAMHQLCEATYPGIGARMCTAGEYASTAGAVGGAAIVTVPDEAWVSPGPVTPVINTVPTKGECSTCFIEDIAVSEAYKIISPTAYNKISCQREYNCNLWTCSGESYSGPAVSPSRGEFIASTCDLSSCVACCAP
jgi:hypothetical protein